MALRRLDVLLEHLWRVEVCALQATPQRRLRERLRQAERYVKPETWVAAAIERLLLHISLGLAPLAETEDGGREQALRVNRRA